MEGAPKRKRQKRARPVTGPELEALLRAFDPNPEIAGRKYETARRFLIKMFRERDLRIVSESLADRALDITAMNVFEGTITGSDLYAYIRGVARRVAAEERRRHHPGPVSPDIADPATPADEESQMKEELSSVGADERLLKTINKLTQTERELIEEYHLHRDKPNKIRRAALALKLRCTPGTLRVRAHRALKRLRDFIDDEKDADQ